MVKHNTPPPSCLLMVAHSWYVLVCRLKIGEPGRKFAVSGSRPEHRSPGTIDETCSLIVIVIVIVGRH